MSDFEAQSNSKGLERVTKWLEDHLRDQEIDSDPLDLVLSLLEHLRKSVRGTDELQYLAGLTDEKPQTSKETQERLLLLKPETIQVSSAALYHDVEDCLASREFGKVPFSPYPTAV